MRFVSKNSIEENIYQVALDKLTLEREISEGLYLLQSIYVRWIEDVKKFIFACFLENEQSEAKSFIRLLKKALGMGDCSKFSPKKQP